MSLARVARRDTPGRNLVSAVAVRARNDVRGRDAGDDRVMDPAAGPSWPAARRVLPLAALALVLFTAALAVRVGCGLGHCTAPAVRRLLDLDAVGGLPRLFTTGVFVAAGTLASRARSAVQGRAGTWWTAVAAMAFGLAVLKLGSAHSLVKGETSPVAALVLGLAVAVPALLALAAGRVWGVPAAAPVVVVLAAYALAALGLDVLTSLVESVQSYVGTTSEAAMTFVEELGEALAALAVLAVVRERVPGGRGGR